MLYQSRVIAPECYSLTDEDMKDYTDEDMELAGKASVYCDAMCVVVNVSPDAPWLTAVSRNGAWYAVLDRHTAMVLQHLYDKDSSVSWPGESEKVKREGLYVDVYCPLAEPEMVTGKVDAQYQLELAPAVIKTDSRTRWIFVR